MAINKRLPEHLRKYASSIFPDMREELVEDNPEEIVMEEDQGVSFENQEYLNIPEEDSVNKTLEDIQKNQVAIPEESPYLALQENLKKQLQDTPDYDKRILDAVKEQQKKEDMYDLWEAASPANKNIIQRMRNKSGREVENLMLEKKLQQEKVDQHVKNISISEELKENQAKSDPNSEISRFIRQSLIDLGMNSLKDFPNVSYNQLKEKYPTLVQALYTQISAKAKVSSSIVGAKAQQAKLLQDIEKFKQAQEFKEKELQQKKEIADVQASLKQRGIEVSKELKQEAAEANKQNKEFSRGVTLNNTADNKLQRMYKDEDYLAYSKSKESFDELDDLIARKKSGQKVKIPEGAAFFKYAKIAQGDSSVVRESDIRNLAGGTDFSTFKIYLDKLESRLRGEQFTATDLEEMKKVVNAVKNRKQEALYNRHVKPIREWASKYNYDLSSNVGADLLDDIDYKFRIADERKKKLEELKNKARSRMQGEN